jgi:DNA-binding NarL/FixJ family response regulator
VDVCGESADGRDAIQRALTTRPDLIILDLTMPVMGGFEAARVLRKILPEIPILVYSMHDGDQLIQDLKQAGVHGFVCKTDISSALLDAIEAIVIRKGVFFPDSARGAQVLA